MSISPPPVVLRLVRESDLDGLFQLANSAVDPVSTLPADRKYLSSRVHDSLRSLYPVVTEPGSESYLFVLTNPENGDILGTSALFARSGGHQPYCTYQIKKRQNAYPPLGLSSEITELHLKLSHDGPSELGTLYLSRKARGQRLGTLLSLARFLFMGLFPERFSQQTIAELRGLTNENLESPFWNAVGQHFFGTDFHTADKHSVTSDKSFILSLIPSNPICVNLLPKDAREAIGQVHPNTLPARKLLEQQGFQPTDEVDLFDAGPTLQAITKDITAITRSQKAHISGVLPENHPTTENALLANTLLDFRCTRTPIAVQPDHTILAPQSIIDTLGLSIGDPIIYLLS